MKTKSPNKPQNPALSSSFKPKLKKKNPQSQKESLQQNKNKASDKGLSPQQTAKDSNFCVTIENLSPKTSVQSLTFHFGRFDRNVSCKIVKKDGSQSGTAVASFSSQQGMEAVLAVTHAVDCRLLKLTPTKQSPGTQATAKRPLESSSSSKDESPSKKVCSAGPQTHTVCAEGLTATTTKELVREYFKRFGRVVDATVTTSGSGKAKTRAALVSYAKENCAKASVNKKKHVLDGVTVSVRLVDGSEERWRADANGAQSSDEQEESSEEEESEEEYNEDDVSVQLQQMMRKQAAAEDSDDEEEDDSEEDDDDDDDDDEDESD